MSLDVPIENAVSVGASVSPSLKRNPRNVFEPEMVIVVGTFTGNVPETKGLSTVPLPSVTMKPACESSPKTVLERVK